MYCRADNTAGAAIRPARWRSRPASRSCRGPVRRN